MSDGRTNPRSEYDEAFGEPGEEDQRTAETVRRAFRDAASPYLSNPLPWFAWALLLPAAALLTPRALELGREAGVTALWSLTILLGGAIEGLSILRQQRRRGRSTLGTWAMRAQGNLSLVAVVLSGVLFWIDEVRFLPALWLLLLGHNLFSLGGLAFPPMRRAGILYQAGGLAALLPASASQPLWAMAAATALGNLWIGWGIVRERAKVRARERGLQAGDEPESGVS